MLLRLYFVKEELGKHFATQSSSDGSDDVMAFETLTEPMYNEPAEPFIPEQFYNYKDKSAEDTEYESKSLRYRMQLSMNTRNHDEWSKNVKIGRTIILACLLLCCNIYQNI